MKPLAFIKTFRDSALSLFRNPILPLAGLLILGFLISLSNLSVYVNKILVSKALNTTPVLVSWTIVFSLIFFAIVSFFLSGLIASAKSQSINILLFLRNSVKYWLKTWILVILGVLIYNAINWGSYLIASKLGKLLNLPLNSARIIFILVYFAGLLLALFLAYSNIFIVLKENSIIRSLKNSIKLTKKIYLETLFVFVIFFAFSYLVNLISQNLIKELINSAVLFPLLVCILVRLFSSEIK